MGKNRIAIILLSAGLLAGGISVANANINNSSNKVQNETLLVNNNNASSKIVNESNVPKNKKGSVAITFMNM